MAQKLLEEGYPFTSHLGYSHSRWNLFKRCKRAYWFQYYGKYDKEFSKSEINRYKDRMSLPLAIGSVTHDMIARFLRRIESGPIDLAENEAIEPYVLAEQYPGIKDALTNVFPIKDRDMGRLVNEVTDRMWVFASSKWPGFFQKALRGAENSYMIDPENSYGEGRIAAVNGIKMKVYAKVDFLVVFKGRTIIVDWKTGKRTGDHDEQGAFYALFVTDTWGEVCTVPVDSVWFYLSERKLDVRDMRSHTVYDREQLEFTRKIVGFRIDEMEEMLVNAESNIPKDRVEFKKVGVIPEQRECQYCQYKELCWGKHDG